MSKWVSKLEDETATLALGRQLAQTLRPGAVIYLEGTLGAGKTTLTRGILCAWGHAGAVKSPTYTLVEVYEFPHGDVYHFDLYRLGDPEELEYMGIRDYFSNSSIAIVEWPTRGKGVLPEADITITITVAGHGREALIGASTPLGREVLDRLRANEE